VVIARLIPIHKVNLPRHDWATEYNLAHSCKITKTENSLVETIDAEWLKARTNMGFEIKVQALVITPCCSYLSANQQSG
jgi:hypothetical protein